MSLQVTGLTRKFGPVTAVEGLSFEIENPSVVGFLGPNGAGKTTTMRMITGFLAPSAGEVKIDGEVVTPDSVAIRRKIGYLPESNPLYTELEVHEYLKFAAELSGLDAARAEERMDFVVARCGLRDVLCEPIFHLSKGFRQRVGLAQAIIHDPQILILDEPTSGLDPNQVIEIRSLISELAREKFVILSTHILSEVQALCKRVLIINEGKLVLDAETNELQQSGGGNVLLRVKKQVPVEEAEDFFRTSLSPRRITARRTGGTISLELSLDDGEATREKIFELCVSGGFKLLELSATGSDLEQIFRQLTVGTDDETK